jgi:hypothetical protein
MDELRDIPCFHIFICRVLHHDGVALMPHSLFSRPPRFGSFRIDKYGRNRPSRTLPWMESEEVYDELWDGWGVVC